MLDISIWNAYVLYKKNGGEKTNLYFRSKLVERLIQNYHSDTNIKKSGRPKSSGILRLTERHYPSFVPPTPKKEAPTRYCAVCCAKRDSKGKEKRVVICVIIAMLGYVLHLASKSITQRKILNNFFQLNTTITIISVEKV